MTRPVKITAEDVEAAMRQAAPIKEDRRQAALKRSNTASKPSADSIRAPIGSDRARKEWMPVPISQLGPSEPPEWIWEGVAARGYITLLTALWKSGKSTLIAHLLRDLGVGGGLVDQASDIKTLVISEESPDIWNRRREELGLTDNVHVICRPFLAKPAWPDWEAFLESVCGIIQAYGYQLVIFDTLSSLWPVTDENDAPQVTAALMPLHTLTVLRVAILLLHHPRKGGGEEGQASRGSGALPSFADAITEMRRFAPSDVHDRRRVITCLSRLGEEPLEMVLELTDAGYVKIGNRAATKVSDRLDIISQLLPTGGIGMTGEQVYVAWPREPKPGDRTIAKDLSEGAKAGRWERVGTGHKGGQYRYRHPEKCDSRTVNVLDARNESEAAKGGQAK